MITSAQENQRMLASLLGVTEEAAAEKLDRRIAVVHGTGEAADLAKEVCDQLARTITVVTGAADLEIVIGAAPSGLTEKCLFVTVTPDRVSMSIAKTPVGDVPVLHGLKRMIAGCYIAAAAIDRAVGIDLGTEVDLFVVDFDSVGATDEVLARPVDLADMVLIGAGAIGNGFLRGLRHLQPTGQLDVCDPKKIGPGNSNRCLYFDDTDVGKGKAETLCGKAAADFPRMTLSAHEAPFAELRKARGRVRRVVVATDTRGGRRQIQKEFPLEVLDASTTGVEEVIVHSHRQPTAGACLACIYKHVPDEAAREREVAESLGVSLDDVRLERVDARVADVIRRKHPHLQPSDLIGKSFDSLFKQMCGQQVVTSRSGKQTLAPFACVSNLAGALLALELARVEAGLQAKNYVFLSPWAPPSARTRLFRPKDPKCEFCHDPTAQQVLVEIWKDALSGEAA